MHGMTRQGGGWDLRNLSKLVKYSGYHNAGFVTEVEGACLKWF